MAKYLWITGMLIHFGSIRVSGQFEPIQTDRPDQTECPFIVPARFLQLEAGFLVEGYKGSRSFQHPGLLWRYGLNDRFEIRMTTEWYTEEGEPKSRTGLLPVSFGIKTLLFEERGLLPQTAFIGHLTSSKLGSKFFQPEHIAPSFRFTMSHTLHPAIGLSYNLGAEWDGDSPKPAYIYTLALGFSLSEHLGAFVEVFGSASKNSPTENSLDGGFTWLVHPHFMVDLSGGVGLAGPAPDYFISTGCSFRFQLVKKYFSNE